MSKFRKTKTAFEAIVQEIDALKAKTDSTKDLTADVDALEADLAHSQALRDRIDEIVLNTDELFKLSNEIDPDRKVFGEKMCVKVYLSSSAWNNSTNRDFSRDDVFSSANVLRSMLYIRMFIQHKRSLSNRSPFYLTHLSPYDCKESRKKD